MSVAENQDQKEGLDRDSSVWNPEEDILGDVSSDSTDAVRDAELDAVGNVESGDRGIRKSEIGEAGDVTTEEAAVDRSTIGEMGDIESGGIGIMGSEIGKVGDIKAERDAITDTFRSEEKSLIDEVGDIEAKYGIRNSEVGKVGDITAERTAIKEAEVGETGVLRAENRAVVDSTVDRIEGIESESIGLKDSEVGHLGDVQAEGTAIGSSTVDVVEGDIVTTHSAFHNSEVDEIYGSIVSQDFREMDGFFSDPRENSLPNLGKWTNTEEWIGGEKEMRSPIFHKTDMPYAVSDEIIGKELDRDSYGGFIAADQIDVTEFNENMFVVTPDSSDEFTDYKGDWNEFKDFLKDSDNLMEGLSTFAPDIDTIEGRDHLLELEEHYSQLLEDFTRDEIQENLRYVQDFADEIEDEQFIEMLDKARNTMETAEKEKVQKFGEIFSSLPGDLQNEFTDALEKRKDSHIGKDLFNIGRKRKYDEFVDGEEYEIVKMMDGGNSVIEKLSDISQPGSSFEADTLGKGLVEMASDRKLPDELADWMKDKYLSLRDGRLQDLMRDMGREEEYGGLPEIDEEAFDEDSPYGEMLEEVIHEYGGEMQFLNHLAEAAGEDYDPDFNLKSKEGRRKHDPNFNPEEDEDFESLWDHVRNEADKDISNKKRAYLIQAVQGLGEKIAREEYENAVGEQHEKEEFTEDEIAALHAHSKYSRNRGVVERILEPDTGPEDLEENQRWLEENNFKYEDFSGHEAETYDVGATANLETTIERKQEELLDEMEDLAGKLGYEVDTIEDVEQLRDQADRPSSTDKQEVYDELFKEKIDEFRGIEDQIGGIPDQITVRPAEPLEAMQMGSHFTNSCLAIGKGNGWSAAANAMDANKQVLYAEDQDGNVVGRLLTAVTEDGRLEDYKVYNNTQADIDDAMNDYVDQFADHLGLERVPEDEKVKDVETLAAEDWYNNAIY